MTKNTLLVIIALSTLSGCSIFSPVKNQSNTTYVINSMPRPIMARSHRNINLVVAPVTTSTLYNTTDMAYTAVPYQIGYLVKSHWGATPPQMLQPLIVQTLQQTHHFKNVLGLSSVGQFDYVLNTQLIQLQQDFTQAYPVVRLAVRVQLINVAHNTIVASKEISINEPLQQANTYSGVIATNNATAKMLAMIAQFCINKI